MSYIFVCIVWFRLIVCRNRFDQQSVSFPARVTVNKCQFEKLCTAGKVAVPIGEGLTLLRECENILDCLRESGSVEKFQKVLEIYLKVSQCAIWHSFTQTKF